MSESIPHREKKLAIAGWLNDAFGIGEEAGSDSYYWRHADDFMKFMKANGFIIQRIEDE